MGFDWRALTMRDAIGFIASVAIFCIVAWVYVAFSGAYVRANLNFGPEWECTNPYNKGPICHKKPPSPGPTVVKN